MADRLLTVVQVAHKLGYRTRSGALKWLISQDCPRHRRGRRLLVYERAVEICLERQTEGDSRARTAHLRKVG